MLNLTDLRAFAYRLAAAALRVGVVLGVALPLVALAIRPWRTTEQIVNESSAKRPYNVAFNVYGVNTTDPFEIVGKNSIPVNSLNGVNCMEVAVRNNSSVDVCIWWLDDTNLGGSCTTAGYNCSAIAAGNALWLLPSGGGSFVSRYPTRKVPTPGGLDFDNSYQALCADPAAAAAGATDLLFVSCLQH